MKDNLRDDNLQEVDDANLELDKNNDTEENDTEKNDTEENNTEENDTEENNTEENDAEENDTEENDTEESNTTDRAIEEKKTLEEDVSEEEKNFYKEKDSYKVDDSHEVEADHEIEDVNEDVNEDVIAKQLTYEKNLEAEEKLSDNIDLRVDEGDKESLIIQPEKKNKNHRLLAFACMGTLAVLIICFCIILFREKSSNKDESVTSTKVDTSENSGNDVTAGAGGETSDSTGQGPDTTTEAGSEVSGDTSATAEVTYPKCEVTLGEYKGLTVTLLPVSVTEEDVNLQLNNLLSAYPTLKDITDRKDAKSGDVATIDYVGKMDGVEFEGGSAEGYELELGSGSFIPGFEDQIIGHTIGEKFDITVTFPTDYTETSLAGKEAVFSITLNKLGTYTDAEATDEFIAANTEYKTVDEYRDGTYNALLQQAQADSDSQKEADLLSTAVENTTYSNLTEEEINASAEEMTSYYENYAAQMGADLETFVTYYFGMDIDTFNTEILKAAELNLKQQYLLEKIVEVEKFTLSDEDYVSKATEYATKYGFTTYQDLETQYGKENIEAVILSDMAKEVIINSAVIAEE